MGWNKVLLLLEAPPSTGELGWFSGHHPRFQPRFPPLWPGFNPGLRSFVGWVSVDVNLTPRVFLRVLYFSSLNKIGWGRIPSIGITSGILPFRWINWIKLLLLLLLLILYLSVFARLYISVGHHWLAAQEKVQCLRKPLQPCHQWSDRCCVCGVMKARERIVIASLLKNNASGFLLSCTSWLKSFSARTILRKTRRFRLQSRQGLGGTQ